MDHSDGDKRVKMVHDLIPDDWDRGPLGLAHELREFLKSIVDEGTNIDSGGGDGIADMATPNEIKVLALLASGSEDFGVMSFAEIANWVRLTHKEIRRACRALKRKGLAEFYRGCWTEDGVPAGSSFGATSLDQEQADTNLVEKFVNKRWS